MTLEGHDSTQTIDGRLPAPLDQGNSLALSHYTTLAERVAQGRIQFDRPLTLAEKVLVSHMRRRDIDEPSRGESYVDLDPDRVALQDALAQIVALQFITAGLDGVVVPTTVHCD